MAERVTIALTLPANGSPDVIEAQREFHLSAGADVVIDSSSDIASIDADWIIESEVGEFWWPRGNSLKEILESVPAAYDSVQAVVRHFARVSEKAFPEGMLYRLSPGAAITDQASEWRPTRKFARRATGSGTASKALRGWYPIEVLRYGGEGASYDEAAAQRGVECGVLIEDTRVRDALRVIRAGGSLEFERPDVFDEAQFALDVAALGDADVFQAQARLDSLEARLSAVESTLPSMLSRKLRRLGRRKVE